MPFHEKRPRINTPANASTRSQQGGVVGLVGGRWKSRWKIAQVGFQALSQGHDHYTTQPAHTYTHTHTEYTEHNHTDSHVIHTAQHMFLSHTTVIYNNSIYFM